MNIALLGLNNLRLELFNFRKDTKPLPNYRNELTKDLQVIGTKHLCFETINLDKHIKELKNKRVNFITQPDNAFFGGRYVFFKDCNGILIELYERS